MEILVGCCNSDGWKNLLHNFNNCLFIRIRDNPFLIKANLYGKIDSKEKMAKQDKRGTVK